MREPQLREVDRKGFLRRLDAMVAVYDAAMSPPRNQLHGRRMIMERHTYHPEFRAFVVERRRTVTGFAYGFRGEPGQWWHDVVRSALIDIAGTDGARQWLDAPFELAELHVSPDHQGNGHGRKLVTELCSGRPETTMVLSTLDLQTPARNLYRSLGLTELLTEFQFPGGGPAYAVMGSALPLRPSA